MEIINTETVVTSLFSAGFDKVDPVLFTLTLGKISLDDMDNNFVFGREETSYAFNKYVDCNNGIFRLRGIYKLDTNISEDVGYSKPLKRALNINDNLVNYLNRLDFSEIIIRKAEIYRIMSLNDSNIEFFSEKEINILKILMFNKKNSIIDNSMINGPVKKLRP